MTDQELELELNEAETRLGDPPSSVDDLLGILDKLESCLTKVEQSPSESMRNAMEPSLKALASENIREHSDVDVKVAAASCVSEITRISALDAPFEDEQMRDLAKELLDTFTARQMGKVFFTNSGSEANDSQDIKKNRSIKDALAFEEFFRKTPAYNGLADHCGIPQMAKKLNQILVQHIKAALPALKSRISSELVAVAKEHQSYGEITESKEVDPCDDLTDDDIRTAIQNATGPRYFYGCCRTMRIDIVKDDFRRSLNRFKYMAYPLEILDPHLHSSATKKPSKNRMSGVCRAKDLIESRRKRSVEYKRNRSTMFTTPSATVEDLVKTQAISQSHVNSDDELVLTILPCLQCESDIIKNNSKMPVIPRSTVPQIKIKIK
ncbi:hypothetical protein Syun_021368 [Stephania yunnanensis]|uniref:Dynamin stalk domain-containing protein n=1 Tax=Stephania yunnanensis TaxID=152371 RepID=A0AAP0IGY1_9MAGN